MVNHLPKKLKGDHFVLLNLIEISAAIESSTLDDGWCHLHFELLLEFLLCGERPNITTKELD
jgi:hypothetical protein